MTVPRHQLHESLSPFVDSLWRYESDPHGPTAERVIPSGQAQIIFPLSDGTSRVSEDGVDWRTISGPVVAGPRATPVFIDPSVMGSTVGVHLRPEGAAALLHSDMNVVSGGAIPLSAFWGFAATDLHSELCEASSGPRRSAILERYLLQHLRPDAGQSRRLKFALQVCQKAPLLPISEVARQTGLSSAQFIEMFRNGIGLTPKRFRRVKRVQKAVALLHSRSQPNLALVALQCGYFDQAHFTRDFSMISGVAPRQYLSGRTSHQNHVAFRQA